jgi:4-hydroxy-2-oxoheptanedioate aldolase
MPVRDNKAKQKLQAGDTIYTSSARLAEPGLCEILGYAGFDFVLLDGEHGAANPATLDCLVQGCFAGGTVPIARMSSPDDPEAVMQVLDIGVQGIMIPHCRTAADARRLRDAALYTPAGRRGFGPGRATMWGRVPFAEYFQTINDTILLLALIEDVAGVENIDEIAAAGLDVLWVGTGDLAFDYGYPGQRNHPTVMAAVERILAACLRHGVVAGFPADNAETARWARDKGFRAIGYGGAEQYVMQASRRFLEELGR